jgi:hypothetical protein
MIDQKALEAAARARYEAASLGIEDAPTWEALSSDSRANHVRLMGVAFEAARPSSVAPDVAGLIADLREAAKATIDEWHGDEQDDAILYNRAATALSSQAAEIASLRKQVDEKDKALEPFSSIAEEWVDDEGWTDLACKNDRICDWFGPSDFRAARRARSAQAEGGAE